MPTDTRSTITANKHCKTDIVTTTNESMLIQLEGLDRVIAIVVIGTTNYGINFGSKIHAENDPNNYDTKNVNNNNSS